MLAVNAGEIVGVFGDYFQDVVGRPGHQMAFKHIRDPTDCLFKRIKNFIGLALQRDLDKNSSWNMHFACIEQGNVTANVTFSLKPLNPSVAGRWRQIHMFGQFGIRHATTSLQSVQNSAIYGVELHRCTTFASLDQYVEFSSAYLTKDRP